MSDRTIFQPSKLTEEQYREKLASDNIIDKFGAIHYEVIQMKPESWSYLRLLTYLEWFFDKVIEAKVPDEIAQKRLQKLNLDNKIDLMKKYELLIEDNFSDVILIKDIRNTIAHTLIYDQEEIDERLRKELKNYSTEDYNDLHPFDKCTGIISEIMSVLTNAIHTNFDFKPTRQYEIKPKK